MLMKFVTVRKLRRIWRYIGIQRQKQFKLLLLLMVLASFAEIVSISAMLPFLGILTNPERIYESTVARPLISIFNISKPSELIIPLTIGFCFAVIVSGSMRLLLLWAGTKLSFVIGSDLNNDIYKKTLYQPYSEHLKKNSSEVISSIVVKTQEVISVINHVVVLLSSLFLILSISITLLLIAPVVSLISFVSIALLYIFIIRTTHKRLLKNSEQIARNYSNVIKSLQEGLGGIRDILIQNTQATYCSIFYKADLLLRRAQANNIFIGGSPRYLVEPLGVTLIALLACSIALQTEGISSAVPILGSLALGAQRLLPLVQNAYQSWTTITGADATLDDTLALLAQPLPSFIDDLSVVNPIEFQRSISLRNVSFRYGEGSAQVLKDINLNILKGSRIGFVGITGSGKSTLIDIIMGLLTPDEGEFKVDGISINSKDPRGWQAHIAHVPQSIYLADATIAENIAFGCSSKEIDMEQVIKAAGLAQIAEAIDKMPFGYQTIVGERGVRLSGGQRQRIGIARALFRKADVLIFDEATSALDSATECMVIEAIRSLRSELTILTIAHRETTLQNCSAIYRLSEGSLICEKDPNR
jgi:ATP-binding cassette subfamily B protein